jgi:zona occludens toxin
MINFLMGAPGGGKSYEAVVFHILPALRDGRKVITNLPLDLAALGALDESFPGLVEIRISARPSLGRWVPGGEGAAFDLTGRTADVAPGTRAFSTVWCYYTEWRHPKSGIGPLFVIDECHLAIPRGATPLAVEEWYSLHRHYLCDVLLLSQGYGKCSRPIVELVQLLYRVRKNTALGFSGSYTRKVQDGVRGEVVNVNQRTYEKAYFALYKSHTQSGAAAREAMASDVRPIWRHWSFIGSALLLGGFGVALAGGGIPNPLSPKAVQSSVDKVMVDGAPVLPLQPSPVRPTGDIVTAGAPPPPPAPSSSSLTSSPEPFAGRGLHLTGHATMGARELWTFALSQNGQLLASLTSTELQQAGYTWRGTSSCHGELSRDGVIRVVVCDAPQVSIGSAISPPGSSASGAI